MFAPEHQGPTAGETSRILTLLRTLPGLVVSCGARLRVKASPGASFRSSSPPRLSRRRDLPAGGSHRTRFRQGLYRGVSEVLPCSASLSLAASLRVMSENRDFCIQSHTTGCRGTVSKRNSARLTWTPAATRICTFRSSHSAKTLWPSSKRASMTASTRMSEVRRRAGRSSTGCPRWTPTVSKWPPRSLMSTPPSCQRMA